MRAGDVLVPDNVGGRPRGKTIRRSIIARIAEAIRYSLTRPKEHKHFHVVSCERNAGEFVCRCLESVYRQDYPRDRITHFVVDDASTDNTPRLIEQWLRAHPDARVEYVRNEKRARILANRVRGFRSAAPGSIVVHLDGDDWLPDRGVLRFLNKVYANEDVWMTYNSRVRYDSGKYRWRRKGHRIPDYVIRENSYREHKWWSSALHTFRAELFQHVPESALTDPETGAYWERGTDMACYFPMLELCGRHAIHIHRTTYVYNVTNFYSSRDDLDKIKDCERRIRLLPRCRPLDTLKTQSDVLGHQMIVGFR